MIFVDVKPALCTTKDRAESVNDRFAACMDVTRCKQEADTLLASVVVRSEFDQRNSPKSAVRKSSFGQSKANRCPRTSSSVVASFGQH